MGSSAALEALELGLGVGVRGAGALVPRWTLGAWTGVRTCVWTGAGEAARRAWTLTAADGERVMRDAEDAGAAGGVPSACCSELGAALGPDGFGVGLPSAGALSAGTVAQS